MLISDSRRFIFVHIFKTGGSSVTKLLGPYVDEKYRAEVQRLEGDGWQGTWHYRGQQHSRLRELRSDPAWNGRDLKLYRICTVVRNPYLWALSVWNDFYRNKTDSWFSALFPSRTFGEYCRFIKAANMGLNKGVWGSYSQSSFIEDPELSPAFVGRFERLLEDIPQMLLMLGIPPADLPHENWDNPQERSDVFSLYDEESLLTVNELFAEDFRAFGYEMIEP